MAISISDAVARAKEAKSSWDVTTTDPFTHVATTIHHGPFSSFSEFKDPTTQVAAEMAAMSSKLSSIASVPGLSTAISTSIGGLNTTMSSLTTGVSTALATKAGALKSTLAAVSTESDLFDLPSPCGIMDAVLGSVGKATTMIKEARDAIKSFLKPITDAIGDIFDTVHQFTEDMIAKLHIIEGKILEGLAAAAGFVTAQLTKFSSMVAAELVAVGNMLGKLVDLSFLDELLPKFQCNDTITSTIKK